MATSASRSIAELHERFRQGHSAEAEIEQRLRRIREDDHRYHAMVTVAAEDALDRARELDRERLGGMASGPLHGVPIAVKDVIDMRGLPTTAGSRLFEQERATEDAACVKRLREAGAILIGKTNLHELTVGGHDNPWFGKVANPLDPERGTGGTSSGSAAAVLAGYCLAAIGTDTGGSNRSPAAATGLVGFKPEVHVVERSGVRPTAPSLDAIGPIASTLEDAWRVHAVISGQADDDLGSPPPVAGLRIGLCPDLHRAKVDTVVEEAIASWLDGARAAGAVTETIPFALAERLQEAGKVILFHEFAVEYGDRVRAHPDRVGPTVLSFLEEASVFDEEAYRNAFLIRDEAKDVFLPLLGSVDLLVAPVAPGLAPRLSDEATRVGSQFTSYGSAGGGFRRWANVLDLPTLAMPVPTPGALPASVQACVLPGMERRLFSLCRALAQAA